MDNKLKKIILLLGDIIVLYVALYLTLLIRYGAKPSEELWWGHFWPFTIVFFVWLLIFYISDLYNLNLAVNNIKFFQLTGRSLIISGLLSVAFFYITPQITIAPKRNMLIYVIVFAVLFYLWRNFYNWSLKAYLPKNNIAFIGLNNQVKELIYELKQKPHLGYNIIFVIDEKSESNEVNGVPVFTKTKELPRLIAAKKIADVVLSGDLYSSEELRALLFSCLPLKINFISLPKFYEKVTGKIPLEAINKIWFLENLNEGNKKFFDFFKRIYDIILAFIVFAITLPFWPLISLIIKLESSGPIFIRMLRVGRNNINFKMYKFRSMKEKNNDRSMTVKNDPRITKSGAIMRKLRLDEIPQVINILKGELSIVGPRPERPELTIGLEKAITFYKERLLVKPGATGWAVVNEYHSPSVEDSIKKLQYDLYYIKNRSIYLDLSIILKTIATVLGKKGR